MYVTNSFPQVYLKLLNKDLLSLKANESRINCQKCLQVPKFKPELKCCTFHPILPNFLVGQIIKDEKQKPTFVSQVLKHKISLDSEVLPIGISVPLSYRQKFKGPINPSFGNSRELLCPYFNLAESNCGIWKNRGSVCTSYFCQSEYGEKGKSFWVQFGDYLHLVEMALAQFALTQMGFNSQQIDLQLQRMAGDITNSETFWGEYSNPNDFYVKSLEIVENLDRSDFEYLLGSQGQKLLNEVLDFGKIWK